MERRLRDRCKYNTLIRDVTIVLRFLLSDNESSTMSAYLSIDSHSSAYSQCLSCELHFQFDSAFFLSFLD